MNNFDCKHQTFKWRTNTSKSDQDSTVVPLATGNGQITCGRRRNTCTRAASYTVHLAAQEIESLSFNQDFAVAVTGMVDTTFRPELYQRYPGNARGTWTGAGSN
jgi:hypothetical protein